ncbi:AraC family transcriptional regulator [Actinoallomurus oryzae]|uniref:helix-turn-helix domain-containing protein n=1 Tax=Actinoallomurus oryzae TaxID=502180 RepID=UPI0031E6C567
MRREISHVMHVIRHRYPEDLSLEELAAVVNLSSCYLSRLFCREIGVPLTRFLGGVRLDAARRKLLCTDESVADIAAQVGCASLGTFTTRFTRTIGVSPGRYRHAALLGEGAAGFGGDHTGMPFVHGSILIWSRSAGLPADRAVALTAVPISFPGAKPVRPCTGEHSYGSTHIAHVPPGDWMISVSTVGAGGEVVVPTAIIGPISVTPGAAVPVELDLQSLMEGDAPMPERSRSGCGTESDFSFLMGEHRLTCGGPAVERVPTL